ncbi:hypothetical protein [uncultured Roseobacter sp.]|uniref:hypothetical protein n=1 Tax=uncultured Roseobacter sp. TaxID=114847 RepID=UPI0026083B09|nr:hypothetical protein [uncultured Roseobacter sp.]
MRRIVFSLLAALGMLATGVAQAGNSADEAIAAFNGVCFKAGQTADAARVRMEARASSPLPFELIFWDRTLEPGPAAFAKIERRCQVTFAGDHTERAVDALRVQMATPPVFGFAIDLPDTHTAETGTTLIEGRELLRGRVAVVHVGLRDGQTFMAVDRLPSGWEDR